MKFCPFCGVRTDIDLRQIHFRDLGHDEAMACPQCTTALGVIEFDMEPPVRIERCTTCLGMFFNPGEVELLLDAQTNPLVWLDPAQIHQITADCGHEREIVYRRCPMCSERMGHLNFGGRSGVILDRCGTHGVWLDGSQLRHLTEWWRAGGKLIYQQNEAARTKRLYAPAGSATEKTSAGTVSYPDVGTFTGGDYDTAFIMTRVIGGILSSILD